MPVVELSPIDKWQVDFKENPLDAVDRLLLGRAYMGKLHRNDTSEILFRLFHVKSTKIQRTLDLAMQDWFKKHWTTTPESISSSRWAEILRSAFLAVDYLTLDRTFRWLASSYYQGRSWLRSLYLAPARDPEGALLRTLALGQKDQDLLPLWMRLCGMEEDLPLHYTSIGILGIRKLPETRGEPPGDLHPVIFKALVKLAEAINEQGKVHKKEGETFWLQECRVIMALYPRSINDYWLKYFLPLIDQNPEGIAAKWLGKVIPNLPERIDRRFHNGKHQNEFYQPPSYEERSKFLKLLKKHPLEEIRAELDDFFDKHRSYARWTGDAEYLVSTFCDFSGKIFKQDADLSLALADEAYNWGPYNPFTWTTLSKIESYHGNYSRAIGLLWEAKRRFPENPKIRTILANTLSKQGERKIAEFIYRQAKIDFPNKGVCHNGLADVLKAQGKLEEAENIYRQTMKDFHDDEVCRNGLAEVLKAQGELEEAEDIYRQTKTDFPNDAVCRAGLAEVLKAQGKLEEAEDIYRQAMKDFSKNVVCRTGLAGVLLQQKRSEEAVTLLKETVKKFPKDKIAREFLMKLKKGEEIPDVLDIYCEESKQELEEEIEGAEKSDKNVDFVLNDQETKSVSQKTEVDEKPTSFAYYISDNEKIEIEIGMTNVYRLASRWAEGEEKTKYKKNASSALEKALEEAPNNTSALLEKGWWLVDQKSDDAEDFFSNQIKFNHPHVLGLHLGLLRHKNLKGEKIEAQQWEDLTKKFPGKSTIVKLEHARQELCGGNGTRLKALETLRKEIHKDINRFPASTRENEKWAVSSIKNSLFKKINVDDKFTDKVILQVSDNFEEHKIMLEGIVEQCVGTI